MGVLAVAEGESVRPSGTLLSPAMAELVEAVGAVRAQVPARLPGAVALADAQTLMCQLDVLKAVLLERIADVEARQLFALADARSTSAWVASQASAVGAGEVALARRFTAMPHLLAQVTSGDLSVKAAQTVGQALEKTAPFVDRPHGLIDGQPGETVLANVVVNGVLQVLCESVGGLADDDPALHALLDELAAIVRAAEGQQARLERAFALVAQRVPQTMLRPALERLVDAVLPLQLEKRQADGHQSRAFKVQRKSDGSGYTITRGDLSTEAGEYLLAVLAALRATDPDNPSDTAAYRALRDTLAGSTPQLPEPSRDAAPAAGIEGGAGQGEAGQGEAGQGEAGQGEAGQGSDTAEPDEPDVLFDELAAADADYDWAGPRLDPRSRVQQDHDALLLALRALLDSGVLGSRGKTAPHVVVTVSVEALNDQPGALPATSATSGASLSASLTRRLLCDSRLTRAVLSLGRRVLEISHTERTAKAHERLALHLRWGGRCAAAGCTSPPGTPLTPHHGNPWSHCHTTALDDQVPFCPTDHHDVHDGHTITLRDGRRLGPHGWITTQAAAA